jgi:uncharacterized protein
MKRFGAAFVLSGLIASAGSQTPPATTPSGPVALSHSLNARLHPAPVSAVKFPDGFWGTRSHLVVERVLATLRQQLDEHGLIDNFLRVTGNKNVPRRGRPSSDADVYKWIEAASWAVASPDTSPLARQNIQAQIEALIPEIAAAQDSSGYLDTNFTGDRAHLRFSDLVHSHEDYCLTRLLLAGIAYYRATQHRSLLDVGQRFADYLAGNYGPSAKPFIAGHPELVSALVELYRTDGETKYLDLARYLLSGSERERLHLKDADVHSLFSGRPFTSRTEFEGQAVNALQAASGATDYFAESGDPAYKRTLDLLWTDLVSRRISIAGGVGLRSGTDSFGEPYEVADSGPGSEAPVAVANVLWSFRMLALTGDARYADVMERALYNGVGAAISVAGGVSCGRGYTTANADKAKAAYYESEYCPPDLSSLVESLGSLFYATSLDGVYVNLFNDSELNWHLEDGTGLRVVQSTNYPWDGEVKFTLYPAKPSQFSFHVRWPAWAPTADVLINGNRASGDFQMGSFLKLTRTWQAGDSISITFGEQPTLIRANPRAAGLYGKAAAERGPLVFALQQADQGTIPVSDLFVRATAPGTVEFHKDLFGGVALLKYPGFVSDKPLSTQPLYEPWKNSIVQSRRPALLVLMPYFAIGSREPEGFETWIPAIRSEAPSTSTVGIRPGGSR